jgi:WD40 repeat protein
MIVRLTLVILLLSISVANKAQRPQISLVRTLGHSDRVTDVAISPDRNSVLTGSRDGSAIHWEVKTGKELRRFAGHQGHRGHIETIAYSRDGQIIATRYTEDRRSLN